MLLLVLWLVVGMCASVDDDGTRDRRLAALMGAFVSDAAAMPLHWIYDTNAIRKILMASNRTNDPEFLPVSHAPFYDYPPGAFTPFGEQMMVVAKSLADKQVVDPQAIADAYQAYYSSPANTSRPFVSYVDNATLGFLANVHMGKRWPHTGAGDSETNAVAHVLPVVAMRAGREGFLRDAEAVIRVVQNNDDAVAFGLTIARILEQVILGSNISSAINTVIVKLKQGTGNPNDAFFAHGLAKMQEWGPRPPVDVTLEIGQACDFPFHVFTAPHLLLHKNYLFVDAIRETIKLGGENADRGSIIGSILAAQSGSIQASIPPTWQVNTMLYKQLLAVAESIVDGGSGAWSTSNKAEEELLTSTALSNSGDGGLVGNSPGCIAHSNHTTSNATRPSSHPEDIAALRALYQATGGPKWIRNACWLNTSVPVCWWDQVLCNTTTWRVRQLRLARNNLVGHLPVEIGGLTHLLDLQLGFNPELGGPIPAEIGQLSMLEHFYSWNTSFTSLPSSVGNLHSLLAIDLSDNLLQGELSASLTSLSRVNTAYFDSARTQNSSLKCPRAVQQWLYGVKYHGPC